MPQLDLATFQSHFIWFATIMCSSYIIYTNLILPIVAHHLKVLFTMAQAKNRFYLKKIKRKRYFIQKKRSAVLRNSIHNNYLFLSKVKKLNDFCENLGK